MNIYAEKGHKITVTEQGINNGYDFDKDNARKHLTVGGIYTVNHTHVGNWSTAVYIEEVPNTPFNSVHFEDYQETKEENLCKHKNTGFVGIVGEVFCDDCQQWID